MELLLTEIAPNVCRVSLRGRGDAAGIDAVETGLTQAVADAKRSALLDMREVAFMGSLGIRMLIRVGRALARGGAKLVLYGVQPMVMEVFETMALAELIPIVPDEASALALVRG